MANAAHTAGVRTKFIDYNAHRSPKTDHWCFACQRDLKPGQPFRAVLVIAGAMAVHPEGPQPTDGSEATFALGMDCARKLGLEWTRAALAKASPTLKDNTHE